ncbi:MAG: SHOCT domain-containing protein [Anaerolineales bacterium]
MGNFGIGGMLLGGLIMLIFWGGLIAVTVIAVRAIWNSGSGRSVSPSQPDDSAVEIAKQRYARGEITREEFLEIKKDLGG